MRTILTTSTATVVICLLLGAAAPLAATEDDPTGAWRLRVNGFVIDSGGFDVSTPEGGRVATQSSASAGGGVSGEYRFTTLIGMELGLLGGGGLDIGFQTSPGQGGVWFTDTMTFNALCAGANFHLTPKSQVDLYLGPTLAYMDYSSVTVSPAYPFGNPFNPPGPVTPVTLSVDNELAIGANFGLDVPFGPESSWLFNANLRFLDATLDGGIPEQRSQAFDPLFVGLGFGYSF